jgi:hypothetical protein
MKNLFSKKTVFKCHKDNRFKAKILILSTGLTLLSYYAKCQEGAAGITNATDEVKKYFGIGTDLMYAVGAILGLIGATKVYNKWNSGDQDTSKVAASWFGSCIFLLVVATILKGFFKV